MMFWVNLFVYGLNKYGMPSSWTNNANLREGGHSVTDSTSERTGSVVPRPKMLDLTIFHRNTENLKLFIIK